MTPALEKYSPSGRAHPTSAILVSVQAVLAGVVLGLLLGLLTPRGSIRTKALIYFVGAFAPAVLVIALSRVFHIRNAVVVGLIAALAGLATAYGHVVIRIASLLEFEMWIWNPISLFEATKVISSSLSYETPGGAVRELTSPEQESFRFELFAPVVAYPITNWIVGATIGSKQPPYCEKCGSWLTEPLHQFYFDLGGTRVTKLGYELKKTGLDNLVAMEAISKQAAEQHHDYVRLDVFGCCEKDDRLVGRVLHSSHVEHAEIERTENDLTGHFYLAPSFVVEIRERLESGDPD